MYKSYLFAFAFLFMLAGCKSTKTTTDKRGADNQAAYREDISEFRPRYGSIETDNKKEAVKEVPPTHHNNKQVNGLLEEIARENRNIKYARGYRIQVYNGNDPQEVNKVKEKVYKLYPDINLYTTYRQPTFKIKAGDYLEKLEAQRAYVQLKKIFPTALLMEEKVNLPTHNEGADKR